jgi:UDP-glucuronate 4-epimerase
VKVLVTGVAGFIGMHCAQRLLERGDEVIGVDNLSPYYSVELKRDRLAQLKGMRFRQLDVADFAALKALFEKEKPHAVLHLAAQAGVRYSVENPQAYLHANVLGFSSVLESCREHPPRHLVYASSSSVYGANSRLPWSEDDDTAPISVYAATKRANEFMARAYHHTYGLNCTGLRYFTVYGPWGRPDMSPMLFANAIMEGRSIQVFNHGDMQRDFTFIDDIVEGTLRVLDKPAARPIYNIGNHEPVALLDYIKKLEKALGKAAKKEMKPMQPGDIKATYADTTALREAVGFEPSIPLEEGLARFAGWFKGYYGHK